MVQSDCYTNEQAWDWNCPSGCRNSGQRAPWAPNGGNRDGACLQDCRNKGYFTTGDYHDCGDWKFQRECINPTIIDDWKDDGCQGSQSRRWSAKINAGSGSWEDAAQWYIDNKVGAIGTSFRGNTIVSKTYNKPAGGTQGIWAWVYVNDTSCQRYPTWDAPVTACDSAYNKLTTQKCNNWGTALIQDASPCVNDTGKPEGIVKWSKCARYSSPGGHSPGDGATVCDPLSDSFNCINSFNCFAVTDYSPNDPSCDPTTYSDPVTGCDSAGNTLTVQQCNNWKNGDANSCNTTQKKPDNIVGWIHCDVLASPGGHVPGNGSTLCDPISDTFSCGNSLNTGNCFAITKIDYLSKECDSTTFDAPVTGCDTAGNIVTIQKCNNWQNNDPNSCDRSSKKPLNAQYWQSCAIGSSAGGHAPGDSATLCGNLSQDFTCSVGQNCFAITEIQHDDFTCPNPGNGMGLYGILPHFLAPVSSFVGTYKQYVYYAVWIVFIIFALADFGLVK